ncbi:3-hydroxyacyl-[acyl-carrier-protein] dehydratase FabZ [Dissulfurirhabdus thermomarina]|uniref:3-hydroxyacyl-[acyl-carrier-protein] dehydratase FabZ n=1 Tax=Dissulfurirhabdus thermomarina TaxID=1765737 RepID=A0A6N9TNS5_DISTH|nr:3-hydroxyacyl-[acyl-carrier-protein] dehydratase FabZ [Dissulfurirhabdus thermomarina]NDY41404.1 3-hydroxyacyl-[acyl-carrier-protein] dehydratase FabZ [Dissulfurirhabdus thermomarina]NMX23580.1 3-hydroxyacyl-[acyl-carrier-protein] dehydratase FabZ [Dissulfurirhabdus thermomarina]
MEIPLRRILEILPHRPPFLLLDAVRVAEPGRRGTGRKRFSGLEPFFRNGRRPANPGGLLLEMMAQAAAVVAGTGAGGQPRPAGPGYLAGARLEAAGAFGPGDLVEAEVVIVKAFGGLVRVEGEARSAGRALARADLAVTLPGRGGR